MIGLGQVLSRHFKIRDNHFPILALFDIDFSALTSYNTILSLLLMLSHMVWFCFWIGKASGTFALATHILWMSFRPCQVQERPGVHLFVWLGAQMRNKISSWKCSILPNSSLIGLTWCSMHFDIPLPGRAVRTPTTALQCTIFQCLELLLLVAHFFNLINIENWRNTFIILNPSFIFYIINCFIVNYK